MSRVSESVHDLEELLDRFELVEGLDHTVEIERDVSVDDDVAEPGKALEFPNQLRGEALVPRQVSNAFRVVLVAVSRFRLISPALKTRSRRQRSN
jgi:hypothetical protein